jgi:hypothetical protein
MTQLFEFAIPHPQSIQRVLPGWQERLAEVAGLPRPKAAV